MFRIHRCICKAGRKK